MQRLKVYAQKTENEGLDYFINLYHKDKETGKTTFKKLRVGFKKGMEMLGSITVKDSLLTFNKIKLPMELIDIETQKPVKVEVPYTAYRLFIWDYEKTPDDEQRDKELAENGTVFIKEYVSPEEKKAKYMQISNQNNNNAQFAEKNNSPVEQEVEEDLDGLELPF